MRNNAEPQPTRTRPHTSISGRWLVAFTLSLLLIVPAVTYLTWSMTKGDPARVSLDYAERSHWFMQPVKPRPLQYDKFVAGETGKQYKKTDLHIAPAVEQRLHTCAQLARSETFFKDAPAREQLEILSADPANGFYPAYLLASWYEVNGDLAKRDQWMQIAYQRAGGALAQRMVDAKHRTLAGYRLPPVAIGYDRVTDGKRDASLVLIYPAPISDSAGMVYLPTYRSVYRLTDPGLQVGEDATLHPIQITLLPQPPLGKQPNWFAVPDGAVGQLPDAVIEDSP